MREGRFTFIALILIAAGLSSCGMINNVKSVSSALTTDCVLAKDQASTFKGRWLKMSVPIAFATGAWNSSEMAAIIRAADTWNSFFAVSMGYPAIDYGSVSSPRTSAIPKPVNNSDFCSQSIFDSQGNFASPVVLYKDGNWPSDYDTGFIAVTTTCTEAYATNKKKITNAYMELNYQYFFVNGNRVPDIQSIVLHEMGHLIGLNHSCDISSNNSQQGGGPLCGSVTDQSYLHASLYPTFSFYSNGQGEIRQSLNSNDQGRTNCLYKY